MGDGNFNLAGDKHVGRETDKQVAANARAATLSEQSWRRDPAGHAPLPEHQTLSDAREYQRMQQTARPAQTPAQNGATDVGPQGTYGAPAMPTVDAPAQPRSADTTVAAQPVTGQIADMPAPKAAFHYNPDSPAPDDQPAAGTTSSPSRTIYDPDRQVGSNPSHHIADATAQLVGTGVATKLVFNYWHDAINDPFVFAKPAFQDAQHISASTWRDFGQARKSAHGFLRTEHNRIVPQVRVMNPDPALRTDAENIIANRLQMVDAARDATAPTMMDGNNPVDKYDFSDLKADAEVPLHPNFVRVTNLDRAQSLLITERDANLKALENTERKMHEQEVGIAKAGRTKDLVALFGAEAVNIGLDNVAPRNRTSWETVIGDLGAPMIMAVPIAGKWAPLIKAATIVGTHAFTHFAFDTEVDDNNPKK